MDELQSLKLETIEERHDFERLLALWDQFREYVELLEKTLAGEMSAEDLQEPNLALQHVMNDEEVRFLEWHDGDRIWNNSVHDLVFSPGSYSGNPDLFKHDVLGATVKFNHLINKQLRTLYELNDKIEALSDENTATSLTKTESGERQKLSTRIKSLDQAGEMVVKWGGRVIPLIPYLKHFLS